MKTRSLNNEVLFAEDRIVQIQRGDIERMKEKAVVNQRRRIRLCAHRELSDPLHEMHIVMAQGTYVRPHKHLSHAESFHLIEGSCDVVFFDDEGAITDVVRMGTYDSGRRFYYRMSEPLYHSLIITSDFLVFHESRSGPFNSSETAFAPWSPEESHLSLVKEFMGRLGRMVEEWKKYTV